MSGARVPGGSADRITLAPDVSDGGLAAMLADLIRQNLEHHPGKEGDFRKLDADIAMEVPDAGVRVTLEFSGGSLVVHDGLRGAPGISISADARTLLALPMVTIWAGLPNLLSRRSRALRNGLLAGGVRIRGMLRHPLTLVRFTRLMSVGGERKAGEERGL